MPKTYMKHPNIPNIHKTFYVIWIPVGSRVSMYGTKIRWSKTNTHHVHFPGFE